jgi:hypothetical protein
VRIINKLNYNTVYASFRYRRLSVYTLQMSLSFMHITLFIQYCLKIKTNGFHQTFICRNRFWRKRVIPKYVVRTFTNVRVRICTYMQMLNRYDSDH